MISLADRTIADLRTLHDELAGIVAALTDSQLTGPSGASEWSIAQVLSHLGSGSEILLASYQSARSGGPAPEPDFSQSVWDRWNAMSPQQQASGFVEHDAILVEALEALTPVQRASLQVEVGFLPEPLSVAGIAGLRLNEVALHGWDVRVALDPAAALSAASADVLTDQLSGPISFLLGFIGKPDALSESAVVDADGVGLVIADSVKLTPGADGATATFDGTRDALLRLLSGRLTPVHTPDSVSVAGNVTLDDLRRVFPGF